MRYFKHCLRFVTIPALSVLLIANTAKATLVVIGNNNVKTTSLTAAQLTNLYLGKTSSIDGQTIAAYNQPSNSNTYANFYHSILGWSVEQVSGYWTQKVFSGEGSQPADVGSGRAAIDFVAKPPELSPMWTVAPCPDPACWAKLKYSTAKQSHLITAAI